MKNSMIINKTRKTVLSEQYKVCKDYLSKSIGLMFHIKHKDMAFIFKSERIVPLHMFFVFFPIDLVFINNENKVVELKENFRPFTFYKPIKKSRIVLELKQGSIKRSLTRNEDVIKIEM